MKKNLLIIYKFILIILVFIMIISLVIILPKKDQLITEYITLNYFEKSMNNYNPDNLKEFVANSENDTLYKQALNVYGTYHYEGVSNYKFKIDKYEEFGNGKYQCYYNYYKEPTCDLMDEGKYINYIIDTTTTYKNVIGKQQTVKEKGLVVFIKDGSNGNIFEWKLVRYNTYIVE